MCPQPRPHIEGWLMFIVVFQSYWEACDPTLRLEVTETHEYWVGAGEHIMFGSVLLQAINLLSEMSGH